MTGVLERRRRRRCRRRSLEALREVRQPNSTAVYSRLCSRALETRSESLSLGGAPFLHRSPEETNVCQRDKGSASRTCEIQFDELPTTARQFGRFLPPDSREIYDIISRKERPLHLARITTPPIPTRQVFLDRFSRGCVASGEKKLFPAPRVSYSRATLYH